MEKYGLQAFLVNASHTTNLPGRKSDVQECQWLMKLHTYGLLRNSSRPPEEIRAMRTIWRQRRAAGGRLRPVHPADAKKALTKMNIQSANHIRDVRGVTGMEIIRAILGGERNPWRLVQVPRPADRRHRRRDRAQPARELAGRRFVRELSPTDSH